MKRMSESLIHIVWILAHLRCIAGFGTSISEASRPRRSLAVATRLIANLVNDVDSLCISPTPVKAARLFATAWKE